MKVLPESSQSGARPTQVKLDPKIDISIRLHFLFSTSRLPFPWMAHIRSHLDEEGNQHRPTPIIRQDRVLVTYLSH
jgi:hypothetical protein